VFSLSEQNSVLHLQMKTDYSIYKIDPENATKNPAFIFEKSESEELKISVKLSY
jgi:hypothetical protein